MNIYFERGKNSHELTKLVGDLKTQEKMRHYPNMMKLVKYLLRKLYGVVSGEISFVRETLVGDGSRLSEFSIRSKGEVFICTISDKEISFNSVDGLYTFKAIDDLSEKARLKDFVLNQDGSIIMERFDSKFMELEIHYRGTGKVLFFRVPMARTSTFPLSLCRKLNQDSDIHGVQKFYYEEFYQEQSDFDRKGLTTVLSVWDASQMQYTDPYSRGIKLDEIQMGLENHLRLVEKRDHTMVILEDGVFTIQNYPFFGGNVDINEAVESLTTRRNRLL